MAKTVKPIFCIRLIKSMELITVYLRNSARQKVAGGFNKGLEPFF